MESEFAKKANHFNRFFASKRTTLNNGSTLPNSVSNKSTVELSSFQFNDQDILKIIRALHVNKAHGCDDILICMIKYVTKNCQCFVYNLYAWVVLTQAPFQTFGTNQTLFLYIRMVINKLSITTGQNLFCLYAEKSCKY